MGPKKIGQKKKPVNQRLTDFLCGERGFNFLIISIHR